MGYSVGKDKGEAGKFAFELWSETNTVEVVGGFVTMADAEAAAQAANRAMLTPMVQAMFAQPEEEISLDDLRAELAGLAF